MSEVSDDVVKLSARSKQQLEQLVATLTELEDLLDPKPAGDGKSLP